MIHFANNTRRFWDGDEAFLVDERLRFILRSLSVKFDEITVTCLVRLPADNASVGGHPKSKHIPTSNPSKRCEACDFVCKTNMQDVLDYTRDHLRQVDILYHDSGSGDHFHIELEANSVIRVEIVGST
jgi:hypothetical protein